MIDPGEHRWVSNEAKLIHVMVEEIAEIIRSNNSDLMETTNNGIFQLLVEVRGLREEIKALREQYGQEVCKLSEEVKVLEEKVKEYAPSAEVRAVKRLL